MYNKYNTRHSGRYNTPGQFIPAGELNPPEQQQQNYQQHYQEQQQLQQQKHEVPAQPSQQSNLYQIQTQDIEMKQEPANSGSANGDEAEKPAWMKSKLGGVRKISNKERRRRQNESLRRLLSPKNALMVLNEMMPNEQVAQQFKVEPAQVGNNNFTYKPSASTFCADLTVEGHTYQGFGDNKLSARNAVAEQAIRDIIIKRMARAQHEPAGAAGTAEAEEEALPMIQLASFALHKLFSEWEHGGHKVPVFKSSGSISEALDAPKTAKPKPAKPAAARALPDAAAAMHPCMLLAHMRPGTQYAERAAAGQSAQTMQFTMAVEVDGHTYIGKAGSKKEARKLAARAACQAVFGIQYPSEMSNM